MSSAINKYKQKDCIIIKTYKDLISFYSEISDIKKDFYDNKTIVKKTGLILEFREVDLRLEELNKITSYLKDIRAECTKNLEKLYD